MAVKKFKSPMCDQSIKVKKNNYQCHMVHLYDINDKPLCSIGHIIKDNIVNDSIYIQNQTFSGLQ